VLGVERGSERVQGCGKAGKGLGVSEGWEGLLVDHPHTTFKRWAASLLDASCKRKACIIEGDSS